MQDTLVAAISNRVSCEVLAAAPAKESLLDRTTPLLFGCFFLWSPYDDSLLS